MSEPRIRNLLNQYCDSHGGGDRNIEIVPGPYGGYSVIFVWEGFEKIEISERLHPILELLWQEFGPNVFADIVRSIRTRTFNERAEEEAIEAAIPPDLPWLASRYH